MTAERWEPDRAPHAQAWPATNLVPAIKRGLRGRCPACGEGKIFAGFLKVAPSCDRCHAPVGSVPSDDVPPYLTILIVGHLVVPLMFYVERAQLPPLWVMSAIFLPLTLVLTLALLRPIKGATIGLMLTLNMLKPGPGAA